MNPVPKSVTVLAVLNILHALVCSLLCTPIAATNFISATGNDPAAIVVALVVGLILWLASLVSVIGSFGLLKHRQWGRRLSLLMACVWMLLYLVLGGLESMGELRALLRSPDPMGLDISRLMGTVVRLLVVLAFHALTLQTMLRREVINGLNPAT